MRELVLITGPIGSGKSTVARSLARRSGQLGRSAAIADLDEVAFAQDGGQDLERFWRRAGIAHASLVAGWFASGVDLVIAHGPFAEAGSYARLSTAAPGAQVLHVLLTVTVEAAIERVAADQDRPPSALSRDPDFVRAAHAAFGDHRLPEVDLAVDTSRLTADEVTDQVARRLAPLA